MIQRLILGFVTITVLAAGGVYLVSELRLNRKYRVAARPVRVLRDSAGLARGEHLYRCITCAGGHGAEGGGAVYLDAGPIGIAAGPNLTRGRGGVGSRRTDADLVRAIRHGVRPDGTSLVGYLGTLPAVDREVPETRLRFLGRVLLAAGKLNLLNAPKTPPVAAPRSIRSGPTIEYGRYLADIASCHPAMGRSSTARRWRLPVRRPRRTSRPPDSRGGARRISSPPCDGDGGRTGGCCTRSCPGSRTGT